MEDPRTNKLILKTTFCISERKTNMSMGKLYSFNDENPIVNVNYRLCDSSSNNLWGELTLEDYRPLTDGGEYVVELEDKNKYQCHLKRRVNGAVKGVPPRYIYRFIGLTK